MPQVEGYNQELSNNEKNILVKIYENFYKDFSNSRVDLFLCGGKLGEDNYRNCLKKHFESCAHVKVFYPEIIFEEYFNTTKTDYLTIENFLGEQVDFICIICESWGAVAELGAFVNNDKLNKKVIALNMKKYETEPSFITRGPIRYLEKNFKTVYYYDNTDDLNICNFLDKKFKDFIKQNNKIRNLNKITGMFYFITILLYLFKSINKVNLTRYIKFIIEYLELDNTKFEITYMAAKKLLFHEKFLILNRENYSLTITGETFMYNFINKKNKSVYNDVIADIIKYRY